MGDMKPDHDKARADAKKLAKVWAAKLCGCGHPGCVTCQGSYLGRAYLAQRAEVERLEERLERLRVALEALAADECETCHSYRHARAALEATNG